MKNKILKFIITGLFIFSLVGAPFIASADPEDELSAISETLPEDETAGDDVLLYEDEDEDFEPENRDPIQPGDSLEGYDLVAEDKGLELYTFAPKGFFEVALKDTVNDKVWHSCPVGWDVTDSDGGMIAGSMLVVDYLDKITLQQYPPVNALPQSVRKGGVTTETIANGVRVNFDFPNNKEQFTIPVEFVLEDGKLLVSVIYEHIKEYGDPEANGGKNCGSFVSSVQLLPSFGAADKGEDGYLFVPDGCGSLIDFDSGSITSELYNQPVYKRDPVLTLAQSSGANEGVHLPVFGLKNGDAAMFAVIREGEALASVMASPSGIDKGFNAVWPAFSYRMVDSILLADKSAKADYVAIMSKDTTKLKKATVEYNFLYGEDANYVGMANLYRAKLQNSVLSGRKADSQVPFYMDVFGGIRKKRSVAGLVVNSVVPMSRFDDTEKMLKDLNDDGVSNIILRYKGWQSGGMDGPPALNAKTESSLGGKKGLASLSGYAKGNNVGLYLDVEFAKVHQSKFGWWPFTYAAKMVSRAPATQDTYRISTFFPNPEEKPYHLMSPNKMDKVTASFVKSFDKMEWNDANIAPSSLGNLLYGDYSRGNSFKDRSQSREVVQEQLNQLKKSGNGKLAVDAGFDYVLEYADYLIGAPMFDSGYDISAHDVPFYQIVLHGVVNYSSIPTNLSEDPVRLMLRQLETGAPPSFVFTWEDSNLIMESRYEHLLSTKFEIWREKAAEDYGTFNEVYKDLNDKLITDHQIISDDIRITTYENGAKIYVNYSDENYSIDGIEIPAKGYKTMGVN